MKNVEQPLNMSGDEFRELGHTLVDRLADYFDDLPAKKVAPDASPAEVSAALGATPLPESGVSATEIVLRAVELLSEGNRHTAHPRQWGYIIGSASPIGALADLIGATFNPNVVTWRSAPMASEIELQAIRWVAELLGYPSSAAGLMVSGGNMANFVGFFAARRAHTGAGLRTDGISRHAGLRVYVSEETHTWVEKATDLSGLGTDAIRWIATDDRQRMRVDALDEQIQSDFAAGLRPFMVVGTAGTVSTGAVDPLFEIADLAARHGIWFHVDGAYGAPAVISQHAPTSLAGLARADSLAIDPHKWLYAPLEAGCALVRNRQHLLDTFTYHPPYYQGHSTEEAELVSFHEMGFQNSRGFRALKVWMILQQAGRKGLTHLVDRDIELAQTLFETLEAEPDFEACTRGLSITTFRYHPADLGSNDDTIRYLDSLNEQLMTKIQRSGKAYLSNAVVDGRFVLRTCITNFRTRLEDVQTLPAIIRPLAQALDRELRPASMHQPA